MPERTCSTPRCSNTKTPHRARIGDGYWCNSCLSWFNRVGDDPANRTGLLDATVCVVVENGEVCGNPVVNKRRGWCDMHRSLASRNGSPTTRHRAGYGKWQATVREAAAATAAECIIPVGWHQRPKVRFNGKMMTAARAVWWIAEGSDPGDGQILHTCHRGAEGCINRRHLYLGDHAQNMRDKVDAGRSPRGEAYHATKLTEEQVAEIRRRYVRGRGPYDRGNSAALAEAFGVGQTTIRVIVRREVWAWL